MIRFILDELGDGHGDIIMKIDATPSFAQFGDLFYMADFLELDPDKINKVPYDLAVEYIKYVQDKFDQVISTDSFVIFDLSDQYIGGLMISSGPKGLTKTTYVTTDQICGHEIDRKTIESLIQERKPTFKRSSSWLLSKEAIDKGLNWSIERIKQTEHQR